MLPRSFVMTLAVIFAGLGAWAGYHYFDHAAEFISAGSVSLMVRFHNEAHELARASFAVAAGLLGFSMPAASLLAGRARKKADYLEVLIWTMLTGLITSGAALLYYRHEAQSLGLKVGEFLSLLRDSKREIALNPLTRSLLFGTCMSLLAGVARGLVSPSTGKKGR